MEESQLSRELLDQISKSFKEEIAKKPSWGSKQLESLYDQVVSKVLMDKLFGSEVKK
jgi:hypothetical protein